MPVVCTICCRLFDTLSNNIHFVVVAGHQLGPCRVTGAHHRPAPHRGVLPPATLLRAEHQHRRGGADGVAGEAAERTGGFLCLLTHNEESAPLLARTPRRQVLPPGLGSLLDALSGCRVHDPPPPSSLCGCTMQEHRDWRRAIVSVVPPRCLLRPHLRAQAREQRRHAPAPTHT